ncbi:ABC transporter substrate-binding protein [Arthrobacter sp. A2-55]|uniref:ABC transporter substrate-binding protein n=1 Tax=Arthrobacter sp. A2-55 TaxID=2897337 RepID=UPI0021CD8EAE|nr:ABC transporter substrate-binding protein [Arthrobacter sp. A2-55]MCU6479975.1 ABC transporter substrate-binding protein [Arthrobacter sp. A2-55]
MKTTIKVRRTAMAAAACLGVVLACSSCGAISVAGAPVSPGTQSGTHQKLADKLPADIRQKGYVVVATNPMYPPFETLDADQKTIRGLDPDLLEAMAKQLGITVKFQQAGFDSIIPGLQAKRYDMAMSGMTDTVQRQDKVKFVDYFQVGGGIVMNAGDPAANGPLPDVLCGKQVGVGIGTITVDLGKKASESCTARGRKPIGIQNFPGVSDSMLALHAGRIGYVWTDTVSAQTQVKKGNGTFVSIPDGTPAAPTGIAFPKDSGALAAAFQSALQAIIDDGSYKSILDTYGLAGGALDTATVNGGKD